MRLAQLLEGAPGAVVPQALRSVPVRGMTEDSRLVRAGDAFVAIRGDVADGHAFVAAAAAAGAAVVLAERALPDAAVPVVVVPELRAVRGRLAARLYGNPGATLTCVGVTGTNGKTSIAHYIADLADRLGQPAGYLGTIGWGRIGALEPARLTTEDPITLQARLAALRDGGCRWAALEVSSHALAQDRVRDVPFRVAVFSNLTRDHLDYHADADAYAAAKARLFRWPGLASAVINVDDAFGRCLAGALAPDVACVRYGSDAEVRVSELALGDAGASGRWHTPWGEAAFAAPVHSAFSVANLAAALGVLCGAGVPLAAFVEAARRLAQVPGRLELLTTPGRPHVVIDYAHTPDALGKVLAALRARTRGRLVCVFGCGGDRDRGKRPLMAAVAEAHADELWLTSDNPRSEPPLAILADMRAGLSGRVAAHDCADRAEAIAAALARARDGDTVLVAGKGHEDYQEIAGQRRPFSDRAVVAELLGADPHGASR